jgi:hypothetical protein
LIFTRPQNGFHLKKYTDVEVTATAKLVGNRTSFISGPWIRPLVVPATRIAEESSWVMTTLKASARKRFAIDPTGLPMVATTSGPSISGATAASRFVW